MFNNRMLRLSSLLVAISLLLGLAITGCSDKDRDKGEESLVKNFSYVYEKEAAGKVGQDATHVKVVATDKDGNILENGAWLDDNVTLHEQAIADQLGEDGKYYAETGVTEAVTDVAYIFYKEDEAGTKFYDSSYGINVESVSEGQEIAAKDEDAYELSFKCYDGEGNERTDCTFTKGEAVVVKVLDGDVDMTNYLTITTDEDILQKMEGTQYLTYSAIATGVAPFYAEFDGITTEQAIGAVTVEVDTTLCLGVDGWYVANDKLYDAGDVEIENPIEAAEEAGKAEYMETEKGHQTLVISGSEEGLTKLVYWVDADGKVTEASTDEVELYTTNGDENVKFNGFEIIGVSPCEEEHVTARTKDGSIESNDIAFKVEGE